MQTHFEPDGVSYSTHHLFSFTPTLQLSLSEREVSYFNAGNEGSYRLLNKQNYVGHGQLGFVTK